MGADGRDGRASDGSNRRFPDRRTFIARSGVGALAIGAGLGSGVLGQSATAQEEAGWIPWRESFDLTDGTTVDDGETAWQIETAGDHPAFAVESSALRAAETDGEGRWLSEPIDVSSVEAVDVRVTVRGSGPLRDGPVEPPAVAGSDAPTDPDADGHFEDVDGDEQVTTDDARALFDNLDAAAVAGATGAFDRNCNDRIDYGDVIALTSIADGTAASDADCRQPGDSLAVSYVLDGTETTVAEFTDDVPADGETVEATELSGDELRLVVTVRTSDSESAYHVDAATVAPAGTDDGPGVEWTLDPITAPVGTDRSISVREFLDGPDAATGTVGVSGLPAGWSYDAGSETLTADGTGDPASSTVAFRWTGPDGATVRGETAVRTVAADGPTVTAVTTSDDGGRLAVSGVGFGAKAQGPPVLVDRVDHAFEYGERTDFDSLSEMQPVLTGRFDGHPDAVWASRSDHVYYTTDRPDRGDDGVSYFLDGEDAWIGGPTAYGGQGGWDLPPDNSQLYLSWWFKPSHNCTRYWRFNPRSQDGEFVAGEPLVIDEGGQAIEGTYVGTDGAGVHNLVVGEGEPEGHTVRGLESGAEATFPTEHRAGSGYGYETPGTKFARVWDTPDGDASIRSSIADTDFYVDGNYVYDSIEFDPGEWHHMEYQVDTDAGTFEAWVDGRSRGAGTFDPAAAEGNLSPTPSLLGLDGKQLKLLESQLDDVYVDSTLQRVVVGDAPRYEDLSHYEVQRPTAWSDTEIELSRNEGTLDADEAYLYVFDGAGAVNDRGYPLTEW